MHSLEAIQQSIAQTLALGPAAMDASLFAMPPARTLLGLKAHANTISHARLVALEDSFPLTRAALGDGLFNALSRDLLEIPGVGRERLARIGSAMPAFLASRGVADGLVDLARAELVWLQVYHAPDARPFELGQVKGLSADAILATLLRPHPSAHVLALAEPADAAFSVFGDVAGACILLFIRPDADVRVTAIEPPARAFFARLTAMAVRHPVPVGDLFDRLLDEAPDDDPSVAFVALAAAGAFALPEESRA